MSEWCPVGPYNAHTHNQARTECIWCGPHALAWKPGRWVDQGDGTAAWSADGVTLTVADRAALTEYVEGR